MTDAKPSPVSPTSPTHNARRSLKRSPRSTSFKRRSAPAGSPLTAPIPEEDAAGANQHQDMAASFLQYCAMCEKQILHPSNSILYCSEACRRKDSCKPLALAAAAMSPTTTPPSSEPSSPRAPLLPPRTPTGTVSTPSIRIPAELHNAKSDLDPTEWKPKLGGRGASEAFRYLSQFHRSTSGVGMEGHHHDEKTLFSHRSTASIASLTTTPTLSLSQTPTTASSSFSMAGAEYDFNTRPLQSRHNPTYSASAGTTRGVDLVMPFVAPPPFTSSLPRPGNDRRYEKRSVARMAPVVADEGLGALIGREGQN